VGHIAGNQYSGLDITITSLDPNIGITGPMIVMTQTKGSIYFFIPFHCWYRIQISIYSLGPILPIKDWYHGSLWLVGYFTCRSTAFSI